MRGTHALLVFWLSFGCYGCWRLNREATTLAAGNAEPVIAGSAKVEFSQLKPILEKCQPCHFSGGKVYSKLPFDRPETIKSLGTKLFTRIHDENERRLIREFLSQQ